MKLLKPAVTIFIAAAVLFAASPAALAFDYTIDNYGRRIPMATAYRHSRNIMSFGDYYQEMFNPSDLFIDENDVLYVVDTGRNRVVQCDLYGAVIRCFDQESGYEFNKPQGVFVDGDGDLYVADTDNSRIVHISEDGEIIEVFVKPVSELLDDEMLFNPTKLVIDNTGFIYITMFENLISIDAYNRFRGYLGQAEVPFSFANLMIRLFASREMKETVTRPTAPPITNVFVDREGMIYCTARDDRNGQIKKFNRAGRNIYPPGQYGESDWYNTASLIDLAVDKNGIITAVDENSAKIYQYDQEGNCLTVFGGLGESNGFFQKPSSIAVDSKGDIYVLDFAAGMIQIFSPTDFIIMVHEATTLNYQARYDEALAIWREIELINRNYPLANEGIAKALYKQGKFEESMENYRKAGDVRGYSEAYDQYRNVTFRRNFSAGVILILLCGAAFVFYIALLRKGSQWILGKYYAYRRGE